MRKIILILLCGILLFGCSNEQKAEKMYAEAKMLEQDNNYQQAIKMYEDIATRYSRTQIASHIQQDIQKAKEAKLKYYISENKPKIIDAVRNYPFPPVFEEKIMRQISSIAQAAGIPFADAPSVDRELKAVAIGICATMGYLASECIMSAKHPFVWDASSTDNEHWIVTMKSYPNKVLAPNSKIHTSIFKVNLSNQTLALTTIGDCGGFAPKLKEKISQKKGKINWEKECVVPLKLEGVLK